METFMINRYGILVLPSDKFTLPITIPALKLLDLIVEPWFAGVLPLGCYDHTKRSEFVKRNKISLIKILRGHYNIGLKEGKDLVDLYQAILEEQEKTI